MVSTYWTGQNVQGSGRGRISGRPGLHYRYLCGSNEEITSIRRTAYASGKIRTGISRIRVRNVIIRRYFVASTFLHHSSHNQTFESPRPPLTGRQVCPLSVLVIRSRVQIYIFWFLSDMLHIYKAPVRTNTASASHTHYTTRMKFHLNYTYRPSPYHTVNTFRLGHKNQSVNDG